MRERMVEEMKRLREENARLSRELAEAKCSLDAIMMRVPEGSTITETPNVSVGKVDKFGREWMDNSKDDMEERTSPGPAKGWAVLQNGHTEGITPANGNELLLAHAMLKREDTINEDWVVNRAELLDLASDCIMVRDPNDMIVFWNAGAEARYGWTKEEAIGQYSHTLLQTKFPEPLERITHELLHEHQWDGELIHVTRDGNEIFVASRWALLRDADGRSRATLEISTDITGRKLMEKQLEEKSNRLQEVNAALKVLLKHRDEERRDFEEALLTNIENLILPYLKRMKTGSLSSTQMALLEILESHLSEITSEFGKTLALQYKVLTPTEMRVAALVREGKTSKEIADLLCISEKTASFHRNNIRTKLGLRGAGTNLRSHLLSLT